MTTLFTSPTSGQFISPIPALCRLAAEVTGQPVERITGPRRHAPIVSLRDAIIWVARHEFGSTNSTIARNLGDRDPSTIHTAYARATARRERDPAFEAFTDFLRDSAIEGSLQ